MLLLHMQEIVFVDSQEGLLSSRGGGGGGQTYWHQAYSGVHDDFIPKKSNCRISFGVSQKIALELFPYIISPIA